MNWPIDSRKDDYYINEQGMYELTFASQQPKAKDFKKHCCNMMFPHIRQQLIKKMEKDYQEALEEKNAAQRDVYQAQLEKCQDQIHDLVINRHVPRANDPGKDNIVTIIERTYCQGQHAKYSISKSTH